MDLSLFSDHGVMTDQEEEVSASEIVKKSSLNNDESSLDTEVMTATTDEMGDAISGETGIVKESFLGSPGKLVGLQHLWEGRREYHSIYKITNFTSLVKYNIHFCFLFSKTLKCEHADFWLLGSIS